VAAVFQTKSFLLQVSLVLVVAAAHQGMDFLARQSCFAAWKIEDGLPTQAVFDLLHPDPFHQIKT